MSNDDFKIILDVDNSMKTVLLVYHKTGIFYDFQVGGMRCNHKCVEGYIVEIGDLFKEFLNEDCRLGCSGGVEWVIDETDGCEDYIKTYKDKLNNLFKNNFTHFSTGNIVIKDIKINDEKINELQEGWWPVLLKILGSSYTHNHETVFGEKEFEGYIHIGNCD